MVLPKVNILLQFDLEIPLLMMDPKEMGKKCLHKDLYVNVCSGIICNRQRVKQLKCPSVGKWINSLWYNP